MAAITVADLTEGKVTGTGVFDQLMRATEAHLEQEYARGRIKGPEYATVYLGAMQSVMSQSLQYLLQEQRTDLEAQLLQEQIDTENLNQLQITQQTANLVKQGEQLDSQTALSDQQKTNMVAEALNIPKQGILLDKQADQATSEIARSSAQKLQIDQQTSNLAAEALNIPKQGILLDKQADQTAAEITRITAQENLITEQVASEVKQNELGGILDKQKDQIVAQTDMTTQQIANLTAEALNIPKQGVVLDKQALQTGAQTSLIDQQAANALTENATMLLQQDKLSAELLLMAKQELKTAAETALLEQKTATEKAQVSGVGVDIDSILGRQKKLYEGQTDGFKRDAEQRAAKIMAETYSIRHSMDAGGTPPNIDNRLQDYYIGGAIDKLLQGVEVDVAALDTESATDTANNPA